MKKLLFVVLTAAVLLWGCGNVGEDPLPSPGQNYNAKGELESLTLFVNGTFYSFDYTAQYDGLQLDGYKSPKPADEYGNRVGGAFSSLSSSKGGGFAGSEGSIYKTEGVNALEFNHHLANNNGETWIITLFNDPPIKLREYKNGVLSNIYKFISFWAKYDAVPEARISSSGIPTPTPEDPRITISAVTRNGVSIVGKGERDVAGEAKFSDEDVNRAKRNEPAIWRYFEFPLVLDTVSPEDNLRYWKIQVPKDAGRIYIDEVILRKSSKD